MNCKTTNGNRRKRRAMTKVIDALYDVLQTNKKWLNSVFQKREE